MKSFTNVCDLYKLALYHSYTNPFHGYLFNNVSRNKALHVQMNHGKVYYNMFHGNIYVYFGYYGSLKHFSFENKTNARRFLQHQLGLIERDMLFLQSEHKRYQQKPLMLNEEEQQYLLEIIGKVTQRKILLENALHSPNISYRSYPIFD